MNSKEIEQEIAVAKTVMRKTRAEKTRDFITFGAVAIVFCGLLAWGIGAEVRYNQERDGRVVAQDNRNDLEDAFIELTNEYQQDTGETPDVTLPSQTPTPSSAPVSQGSPGEPGQDGQNGINGLDGRGVRGVTCNADGSWTFLFSDGTSQRVSGPCVGAEGVAGPVGGTGPVGATGQPGQSIVGAPGPVGPQGEAITGPPGPVGPQGAPGAAGSNGNDGRGLAGMQCNADATWTIMFTDGTSQTIAGPCRGEQPVIPPINPEQ